ncbi:hypothetical protein KOW79_015053 [Hemibagrus wyckioides]|uniref:G-protein coupled receptors family 1 profile domain-containing protein n=1 Tax=Hemibagrus wyckioides TaxID=337641 RepID=A0A9D3NHG4_9TELE|nr:hypothetical protein KOW79_015053 [Hemibagrus wyckioides]
MIISITGKLLYDQIGGNLRSNAPHSKQQLCRVVDIMQNLTEFPDNGTSNNSTSIILKNGPLILAAMSLERYVAIFYPLSRPISWRPERIWVIALSLWIISCIPPTVDFILMRPSVGWDVFTTPLACKTTVLNSLPIQTLFKVAVNAIFFAAVAAIIFFTYIRILLETRKMRQDRASVTKALHTVVLHGFQLLLSMMVFTFPITENLIVLNVRWMQEHIQFFNYFCFVLLPRFLSPLIYGLRDESLRIYMKKAMPCCRARIGPHKISK